MIRIVGLGLLASFFFSSIHILNKLTVLEHGHWIWTAVLRYLFFGTFMALFIRMKLGSGALTSVWQVFSRYWQFWIIALSPMMFGGYALICFATTYAPVWVIATTCQISIVATPLVLGFFGKPAPRKALILSSITFAGAALANLSRADEAPLLEIILYGALPILYAGLTGPIFWYLVTEVSNGSDHKWIPRIPDEIIKSKSATITILIMGSFPLMIALTIAGLTSGDMPLLPTGGQIWQTGLNALLTGVIAVNIYFYVRNSLRGDSYKIAALDSMNACQVLFVLAGEAILLGGDLPNLVGAAGIGLVVLGNTAYIFGTVPRKPASVPTTD